MMLQARNVHKIYRQNKNPLHVLQGIDLQVRSGDILTIVGPSGAGKSTLLHILGGLDDPNEGAVLWEGRDIYELDDNQRARLRNENMGFVFQFYHLLPEFTALENVMMPALVRKEAERQDRLRARALDLLGQVGLQPRALHRPSELSGGEQQRVAIARALMNDPRIVFCDEPTGNLDSQSGKEIVQLLFELNEKTQQTLVIVTHDEHIAQLSHTVVHMRDGILER